MIALKRPPQVYFVHGLWIALTTFYAIRNTTEFGRWMLIAMAAVGTISFLSIVIRRNYFEVKNNALIINRDYFRTQSVALDEIEKVDIQPGPFASSNIILKDKTRIKFLVSQTSLKDLKHFMDQLGIPVE